MLSELTAAGFTLIDLRGTELDKSAFIATVRSRQILFERIEPISSRVRFYGDIAIVNGLTRMTVRVGKTSRTLASRYSHAYAAKGLWRLVLAQGIPVGPVPDM